MENSILTPEEEKQAYEEFKQLFNETGKEPIQEKKNEKPPMWVSASSIKQRDPLFLRAGIPGDNITLIIGDGGVGKSLLECMLVASITTGKPFLFDRHQEKFEPGRAILINAEDSFSRQVSHRLEDAGADMDMVITHNPDCETPPLIDAHLFSIIEQTRPKLVVLDPLQSFLGNGVAMERRNVMRKQLAPLQKIADAYMCAVVIVLHTNKRPGAYGRSRCADSADIWDICRSAFIMDHTYDGDGTRYISHEKHSYGAQLPTQICSIDNGGLYRIGESDKKDRDYVLERDRKAGRPSKARSAARDVILEAFSNNDGKLTGKQLKIIAEQNDISESTLQRVKKELNTNQQLTIQHFGGGANHETLYTLGE